MSYFIKQSSSSNTLLFLMISSVDHINAVAGITPSVTLSKNGGAFASPIGAVTEIANGWYKVAGNATDSDTLGPLILHATGTGCDPTDQIFRVVAFNPDVATNLGLSALPTATAGANGGLGTVDSNNKIAGVTGVSFPASVMAAGAVTVSTNNDKTGYSVSTVLDKTGYTASTIQDKTGYTVSTVSDKTGYSLSSTGLDSIATTASTGAAATFPAMLIQLWRRFFKKATVTATQLQTFADNNTTVLTTQSLADTGTVQTLGDAH